MIVIESQKTVQKLCLCLKNTVLPFSLLYQTVCVRDSFLHSLTPMLLEKKNLVYGKEKLSHTHQHHFVWGGPKVIAQSTNYKLWHNWIVKKDVPLPGSHHFEAFNKRVHNLNWLSYFTPPTLFKFLNCKALYWALSPLIFDHKRLLCWWW